MLADIAADARSELAEYGHDLRRPQHPLETVHEHERDREWRRGYADVLLDALSAERVVSAAA